MCTYYKQTIYDWSKLKMFPEHVKYDGCGHNILPHHGVCHHFAVGNCITWEVADGWMEPQKPQDSSAK